MDRAARAVTPVTALATGALDGRFITLEPLEERHRSGLTEAGADPAIWRYIPVEPFAAFGVRFDLQLREAQKGTLIPYAVRWKSDGSLVGSTSYLAIAPEHARVEIGFTWYRPEAQATAVNPEAKYLLLKNAFTAHYNRVEFKTDSRNARSRAALKKLGATEEGVFRGHMWMPQGYFRDSAYFSILASEWPAVSAALQKRIAAFG